MVEDEFIKYEKGEITYEALKNKIDDLVDQLEYNFKTIDQNLNSIGKAVMEKKL